MSSTDRSGPGDPSPRADQRLDLPGLDEDLRRELDERINEFEHLHGHDVAHGGAGWVPRIRSVDYMIAGAVNLLIIVWLVLALMGGE
jgi:hypothetical protein